MQREQQLEYHTQRASRELDLGLSAQSTNAARSHLQLASMHMQRVKELSTSPAECRPLLSM